MIRDVVPDQQHVYNMTNLNEIKNFHKKLKPKLQTLFWLTSNDSNNPKLTLNNKIKAFSKQMGKDSYI